MDATRCHNIEPSIERRLDAALLPFASARTDLSLSALEVVRTSLNARRRDDADRLDTSGVAVDDVEVQTGSARTVPVRIYRGAEPSAPAVIYCHSGAFVLGNLDTDHRWCIELARRGQCTVVSVGYRLAPEHHYPAALDDAAAILSWVVDNADELGIDATRLAVAGSSAGAALAASVANRARTGALPPIALQLLHQPVLDDRPTASKAEFTSTPGFDGIAAELMWRHYLGETPAEAGAVPGRTTELSGTAATFITVSELDPLRDEGIDYALRLKRAGTAVELQVIPGTCHGFDSFLPDWETSRQVFEHAGQALRRAFQQGD